MTDHMATRFIRIFEYFGNRYFDHIDDPDTLKKDYRRLTLDKHPDRGGSTAEMQEINRQYKEAQVRIATGGRSVGSGKSTGGNQGEQNTQGNNRGQQGTKTQGNNTNYGGKETGGSRKKKTTPEERAKRARSADEQYRKELARAKEKLDRSTKNAHEDFQKSVRENPSNFDNIEFLYKEQLRQIKHAYEKALDQAERMLRSGH